MRTRVLLGVGALAMALSLPVGAPQDEETASAAPDLVGVYALRPKDAPAGARPVHMSISSQRGGQFLVGCALPTGKAADDWEGRGIVDADGDGSYAWTFPDGKRGKTTIKVEDDGTIRGKVRGAGLDWDYVGTRLGKKRTAPDLVGTYALYRTDTNALEAHMTIHAQRGGQFIVTNTIPTEKGEDDWEGRGTVDEAGDGRYDWVHAGGTKGKTTFSVNEKGELEGEVRAAGGADRFSWDYVGKRLEGPVVLKKKRKK